MTSSTPAEPAGIDLRDPSLYINRELSWLEFNARVVANAERESVPLLERLKFVAIAVSNLDEFYMVRVAGLRKRAAGAAEAGGENPTQVLHEVGVRAKDLSLRLSNVLTQSILPGLEAHGVRFLTPSKLSDKQRERLSTFYRREVHPCLTPIAIDPAHPFPQLRNQSLNIALRIEPLKQGRKMPPLESTDGTLLALVQVPRMLPRFIPVEDPDVRYAFIHLEACIAMHASELFPGHRIGEAQPFRVTRASDLEIIEEEADNLLTTIQDELRRRELGDAVRLELVAETSSRLQEDLRELLEIEEDHVHRHPEFIATRDLFSLYRAIDLPHLKEEPFSPVAFPGLRYSQDLFRSIRKRDILLFHPYDSFTHVVDFIESASDDPDVVAIKQTLYRTSGDSPIVRALARAAQNGKQVTALVELKARFDEAANIAWARALEESGVHVVYGLLGLKTHCKVLLVIRKEENDLRRYLHLSTGNYNPTTARLYTDLSLLTAREDLTADAMLLFNVLTGYGDLPPMKRLIVSPFHTRQHVYGLIERELRHQEKGRPARIIAKMNSLVDPGVIERLYEASQAGVRIDLLVRGTCSLRPGVPGVSDNITVRALIDRFLEHSRIFYWENGGEPEVYLGSADWMPRNLNRRVEVSFPILDPALVERIRDEILTTELADNTASWTLKPDGSYEPRSPGPEEPSVRAQQVFMALARQRGKTARTTVRREFQARSASGALAMNPVLRAAELKSRRRNRT